MKEKKPIEENYHKYVLTHFKVNSSTIVFVKPRENLIYKHCSFDYGEDSSVHIKHLPLAYFTTWIVLDESPKN